MVLNGIRKIGIVLVASAFVLVVGAYFFWLLGAPPRTAAQIFTVAKGEGLWDIATNLEERGFVRSASAFTLYATLKGAARDLKPGLYLVSEATTTADLLSALRRGSHVEVDVVIPEGATLYQIDRILADHAVLPRGALIAYAASASTTPEGYLFPDRYRFFRDSTVAQVVEKMRITFAEKAEPLLRGLSPEKANDVVVRASVLEKEVPDFEDRRVVAGILEKRVAAKMPLQVDATICYIKQIKALSAVPCWPIASTDLKQDSPYNTYLYRGWPPAPIGNPGTEAIRAALSPVRSRYWFYLSDLSTGKTIFSETLDEHSQNRAKYLR